MAYRGQHGYLARPGGSLRRPNGGGQATQEAVLQPQIVPDGQLHPGGRHGRVPGERRPLLGRLRQFMSGVEVLWCFREYQLGQRTVFGGTSTTTVLQCVHIRV